MINSLAAAVSNFNTADIIVVVILAIGVLAGLITGFAKMLNGALGTIIAIIVAVVLGIFLSDKFSQISFMQSLFDKIENGITGWASATDNLAKVDGSAILISSGGNWVPLTDMYSSGIQSKVVEIVQPILIKLCGSSLTGTATLAAVITGFIVNVISGVILFILGVTVTIILFNLLSKLFYQIVTKQKSLRVIDRIIGFIFSAAMSVVIVYVVMFVVTKLGPSATGFTDMINDSTVAKWFYENNPFVVLLSK